MNNKNRITFFLLYLLIHLHLLRNITSAYSMLLLTIYFLAFSIYVFPNIRQIQFNKLMRFYILFLITAMYACLYTVLVYGVTSGVAASSRYMLTMPLAFFGFFLDPTTDEIMFILKVFVIVVLIASLTIPFQFVFGPVYWFAELSERAGIIRYSTLFGSLPTIGIIGPFAMYLLLVSNFKIWTKYLIGFLLVSCLIMTLQKTIAIGILLSFLVFLITFSNKIKKKYIILFLVAIPILVGLAFFIASYLDLPLTNSIEYIYASSGADDDVSARGADVTILESMVDRNTELPLRSLTDLYRTNGVLGFLFGGTLAQMGTATMKEGEVPFDMPHNNFVDFILIGGVLQLCLFLAMLFTFSKNLKRLSSLSLIDKDRLHIYKSLFGFLILFVINMFFTSSLTMHPNLSPMFWLSIGFVAREQNKTMNTQSSTNW